MLVSHTHKFIFLKTHKTASTSVAMAFEPFCTPDEHVVAMGTPAILSAFGIVGARDGENRKWRKNEPIWKGHMTAEELSRRLPIEWSKYLKFTCVRNPFDRALSKFLFRMRNSGAARFASVDAIREGLSRWLHGGGLKSDSRITMLNGEAAFDEVIRFENLKDDIGRIAKRVGVEVDTDNLPHARNNAASRLGCSVDDVFDRHMREIVVTADRWVIEAGFYQDDPMVQSIIASDCIAHLDRSETRAIPDHEARS
ncbi:MAG: sulfotransferase family 2 domain-containing protein [Pseudomonadota bacterium]